MRSLYRYGKDIPYRLGMLAINDEELTARYVYFDKSEAELFDYMEIFDGTNCEW